MGHLIRAFILLIGLAVPLHAEPVSLGTTIVSRDDVTVTSTRTLVAERNSNRAFLSCTNTSASVNVRWGDNAITASRGQRVSFGAAIQVTNIDAVYMISEGANVSVSCTEETR